MNLIWKQQFWGFDVLTTVQSFLLTFLYCLFYALQLAHGADPTMKNQEGQTPLDLTSVGFYCCFFL